MNGFTSIFSKIKLLATIYISTYAVRSNVVRVSINKRPQIVDLRKRIGDWELDIIIGKGHQ